MGTTTGASVAPHVQSRILCLIKGKKYRERSSQDIVIDLCCKISIFFSDLSHKNHPQITENDTGSIFGPTGKKQITQGI